MKQNVLFYLASVFCFFGKAFHIIAFFCCEVLILFFAKQLILNRPHSGTPAPEIRWFRDSDDVTNSHNYDVVRTADGRTTLTINEVFAEDAAEFTCRATNEHGEASSTAELLVQS